MNNDIKKLPLEYPLKESLRIYTKRLAMFFAVVLLNFILLGFILLIARSSSQLSLTTFLMTTFLALLVVLLSEVLFGYQYKYKRMKLTRRYYGRWREYRPRARRRYWRVARVFYRPWILLIVVVLLFVAAWLVSVVFKK
jgi:hypothetical protein